MEKIAENQHAGDVANTGIGLGMGIGVAGQVGNLFNGLGQNLKVGMTGSDRGAEKENSVVCKKCGSINPAGMKFCGECGTEMVSNITCPFCGASVVAGMKFCGECGKQIVPLKCPSCGFDSKPGMKFCGNCGYKF